MTAGYVKKEDQFTWIYSDEPHRSRRREILQKYPQIKKLYGPEPLTFWVVLGIFCLQMFMAHTMRDYSWPALILAAYVVGGTVNHTLQLAVHELSHNLAFKTAAANRWLAMFANLPTGVPSAVTFVKYHMEHHLFQGVDGVDTDIPSAWEVRFFNTSTPMKALWMLLQPAFYAIRPLIINPKDPDFWAIVNAVCCLSFDAGIVHLLGWKAFAYLIIGTLLGLGIHPCAGHFIAEHYQFTENQETYSYYGSCNFFNLNVGYHNEHHDFPKIPWTRLPQVKKIAPEYYDLPHYTSYIAVIWRFITDSSIGPFSRIKRPSPEAVKAHLAKINQKAAATKQD